ncbi:MAG: GatB/YqeY domain-containing protein [Flammeovirgaceae bacterium]
MTLKEKVEAEMKAAMKSQDKERLTALRSIKSMILLEETKEGGGNGISADAEIKMLTKAAKQRKESADIYIKEGRQDLASKELAELAVIESFLPKQMSDEELKTALKEIIAKVGATSAKDMGKVMGTATKELAGKADGKKISEFVKSLLS